MTRKALTVSARGTFGYPSPAAYEPHLSLEGSSGRLHAEVLGAQTQRGMAGVPCLGSLGAGGDGARFVSPLYP